MIQDTQKDSNRYVSFIVPVYNKSVIQFKKCLNSILFQNNFIKEILVIDDGSKAELGKEYALISKKLGARYIYQKNMGVSSARNKGIKEARGEYIAFADADDILKPQAIHFQDFDDKPDLIIYDVIKKISNFSEDKIFSFPTKAVYLKSKELLKYAFSESLINWSVAKLYSKKFLVNHNLCFNESLKQGEDLDFVSRAILSEPHIKYCSRINYVYNFTTSTGDKRIEQDPLGLLHDAEKIYKLHIHLLELMPVRMQNKLNQLVCSEAAKELLRITTMVLIKKPRYFIKNHSKFKSYASELKNNLTYNSFYRKSLSSIEKKNILFLYFYGYSRLIYHKLVKK